MKKHPGIKMKRELMFLLETSAKTEKRPVQQVQDSHSSSKAEQQPHNLKESILPRQDEIGELRIEQSLSPKARVPQKTICMENQIEDVCTVHEDITTPSPQPPKLNESPSSAPNGLETELLSFKFDATQLQHASPTSTASPKAVSPAFRQLKRPRPKSNALAREIRLLDWTVNSPPAKHSTLRHPWRTTIATQPNHKAQALPQPVCSDVADKTNPREQIVSTPSSVLSTPARTLQSQQTGASAAFQPLRSDANGRDSSTDTIYGIPPVEVTHRHQANLHSVSSVGGQEGGEELRRPLEPPANVKSPQAFARRSKPSAKSGKKRQHVEHL